MNFRDKLISVSIGYVSDLTVVSNRHLTVHCFFLLLLTKVAELVLTLYV